jgi:hypothetical protein
MRIGVTDIAEICKFFSVIFFKMQNKFVGLMELKFGFNFIAITSGSLELFRWEFV